jgi:DNA-binding MarR family transcriptional regulator
VRLIERQLRELITCFDVLYQRLMLSRPPLVMSDVELSRQELRMVMVLGGKGTSNMSDLARVSNLAQSTVTNTIDKLVGKALVERTRTDADRRTVQVDLTDKGKGIYQSFLEWQFAMGRSMLEALSPGEREIFLELMTKMTGHRPSPIASDVEQIVECQ